MIDNQKINFVSNHVTPIYKRYGIYNFTGKTDHA